MSAYAPTLNFLPNLHIDPYRPCIPYKIYYVHHKSCVQCTCGRRRHRTVELADRRVSVGHRRRRRDVGIGRRRREGRCGSRRVRTVRSCMRGRGRGIRRGHRALWSAEDLLGSGGNEEPGIIATGIPMEAETAFCGTL